jgi:hypothetical protein
VQRHLKQIGYCNVLIYKKPILTEDQKQKRVEWAHCHKHDDWSRTTFSDKTSVQLFRNTVRRWSKHPAGEVKRVPKYRQKVMIWGAIEPNGTIGLCPFRETMTAAKYINIFKVNLLPAARANSMMTGDCSRTMIQSIQLGSQKYLWMRMSDQ